MEPYLRGSRNARASICLMSEAPLDHISGRFALPVIRSVMTVPVIVDRFVTAYLPETRDGEPAPLTLEYAFSPSLIEALDFLRGVVTESTTGCGAALYIYDLDTGISGGGT